MTTGLDIRTIIEFVKHDWFKMFMDIIDQKINLYTQELLKKDPTKNEMKYNRYDIIREEIESLTEIRAEPIYLLSCLMSEVDEENRNLIQSLIEKAKK